MTSYRFFRMAADSHVDLIWIILDHPRSAVVHLSLILSFGLDQIYGFGDIAIFIFQRFA